MSHSASPAEPLDRLRDLGLADAHLQAQLTPLDAEPLAPRLVFIRNFVTQDE